MKRYRVELSPEALEQAQAIRAWWIENRPAAPDLFNELPLRVELLPFLFVRSGRPLVAAREAPADTTAPSTPPVNTR